MRHFNWQIRLMNGLVLSGMLLGWADSALAQRRPIADETLGNERSIVTPEGNIRGVPGDRIEGGARRGNNLFHSFREFNVEAGRAVYFADPGVQNILGRVTGGTASEILGRLGVLGNANLFLLNPSGILFGPNARLDVGGSFVATTADAMQFGEQGFFSATDPTAPPLLTVQPDAFLFNRLNPAPIVNNSSVPAAESPSGLPEFGLRVPAGENITLLGGNISMDGGGLVALGGRVEIGGLSQPGAVTYNADGSLGFPIGVARSDVSLTNGSRINAVADGGSITVNAGALEILDSILLAGIGLNSGFVGAQGGDITLNASAIRIQGQNAQNAGIGNSVRDGGTGNAGNVIINAGDRAAFDGSFILSNVGRSNSNTVAVGDSGNIQITTPSLSLSNNANLQSISYGQGNAGNVIINAPDRVSLDDSDILSGVARSANTTGVGNVGDIRITTDSLSLSNDARLSASISGQGTAGNVIIQARDRVAIDSSVIFSIVVGDNVNGFGVGNAGDIRITTGSLFLTNGAQLQALTLGQGDAGNVIIHARDRVSLAGASPTDPEIRSAIFSSVGSVNSDTLAVGNGGDIRITTGSLSLTNGARLNVGTYGQGNGGDIRITTGSLSLTNGSQLVASTLGQGDAGNVIIHARDRVSLDGASPTVPGARSAIISSVGLIDSDATAVGNGGDIRITTGSLFLTNSAQLNVDTLRQGNAGNVIIHARDRVSLDGASPTIKASSGISSRVGAVNSDVLAVGNGGDIRITTGSFSLTNGAQLSVSTLGQGDAGNVIIHARDRVSLAGASPTDSKLQSAIFSSVGAHNANTVAVGDGGVIRITTGSLSLTNDAALEATTSSGQGRGGDVNIAADSIRLADRGSISTSTQNRFPGGTVTLNANSFEATGGSQINTATNSTGRAGNIFLNVVDRVTLSGTTSDSPVSDQGASSGLYASTVRGSAAPGGTIQITAGELQVLDQARIAVDSQGSGIGGDIDITASSVQLDDRSRITAETFANNGGDITLHDVGLLQLGNNSFISTTAGNDRAGGNGGNININADFIVSPLNDHSDIRANAFTGNGGNVRIDSQGLFGIAAQPQDNPLTSDITASSERGVQGTVNITTPDVDPRRGLSELPVAIVDASDQITRSCPGVGGRGQTDEFVVSGRGGLPPSPIDSLIGEESLADWNTLDEEDGKATPALPNQNSDPASAPIVEAQGWVVGEDGNVKLIAAAPASTIQPPAMCP